MNLREASIRSLLKKQAMMLHDNKDASYRYRHITGQIRKRLIKIRMGLAEYLSLSKEDAERWQNLMNR